MSIHKNTFAIYIIVGLLTVFSIFILIQDRRPPKSFGDSRMLDSEAVDSIQVIDKGLNLLFRINLKLSEFSEPILVEVPNNLNKLDAIRKDNDGVLDAYIRSCNPISISFEDFVIFSTTDYRKQTGRLTASDYEAEMSRLNLLAEERGIIPSTKAVLLYKLFVTGKFGELCYLVKMPPFTSIEDLPSVREEDLTYTLFTRSDGRWKLESTHKIADNDLTFLDYRNRGQLRKLSSAEKIYLNDDNSGIEKFE